jgi:hypothetical protein
LTLCARDILTRLISRAAILALTCVACGRFGFGSPDSGTGDGFVFDSIYPNANFVFVTSRAYTGNLGGLAGADAICQTHAAEAGLPGTYVAWLATSTVTAPSRLAPARGFRFTRPYTATARPAARW